MRFVFIWWLTFWTVGVSAQYAVAVNDPLEVVNLAKNAHYLRDPTGGMMIPEVLSSTNNARWQPVNKQVVSFGITKDVYWIRVPLQNNTGRPLLLKVANNALTEVRVYETVNNQVTGEHFSGATQPFAQRQLLDVDYLFPLKVTPGAAATVYIRVQHFRGTHFPLLAGTGAAFYNEAGRRNLLQGMYYGFMLLMVLYNLFIYFSLRDSSYLYYVVYVFLMGLFNASVTGYAFRYIWPNLPALNAYEDILSALVCMAGILFTVNFLNTKQNAPVFHRVLLALLAAYTVIGAVVGAGYFYPGSVAVETLSLVLVLVLFGAAYRVLQKGYQPALFFLFAWSLLLISVVVFVLKDFDVLPYTDFTESSLQIGSAVEALLLSMALANRINVLKKEKQEAQWETLRSLEKNRTLMAEQNEMLEKKVEERTSELKLANKELLTALKNLKDTQAQLVQREKMASLGELIAGIAHEIQNPLNFVNNFSENNAELLAELKQAVDTGNNTEALALVEQTIANEERITHHGKRADSIVKNMLQHSRSKAEQKELADINALVDEYLRLSYHGLRAQDKLFNATLETHFDPAAGCLYIIPQEIGRVLLNLFNNAFYSVNKKKKAKPDYNPVVRVQTQRSADSVIICISDNGLGIPEAIFDKIFQPFFTTKPVGEGTGLGLSLSYDIVANGHAGQMTVETKDGDFTTFKIILPTQTNHLNFTSLTPPAHEDISS